MPKLVPLMRASEMRTMSRTPLARSFFGIGSAPHSGRPGRADRAAVLQHQHGGLVDLEVGIVDAAGEVVAVGEDHSPAAVLQEGGRGRRVLDDGAVRRERCPSAPRCRPRTATRIVERPDDVVVDNLGIRDRLAEACVPPTVRQDRSRRGASWLHQRRAGRRRSRSPP